MANVGTTQIDRFTNTVEHTGNVIDALDEWFEVHAHSASYTFAANVTSEANFTLALEANFNGNGAFGILFAETPGLVFSANTVRDNGASGLVNALSQGELTQNLFGGNGGIAIDISETDH